MIRSAWAILLAISSCTSTPERTANFIENTATALAPDVTLTDDGTTLADVTVTLTNPKTGDVLQDPTLGTTDGDVGNIHLDFNAGATAVILTAKAATTPTVAEFQTALRALQFSSDSEKPDTTDRTITITANDGSLSTTATATVTVASVNDAPVLDLDTSDALATTSHAANYTVSQTPVAVTGTVAITDPDPGDSVGSAKIDITDAKAGDELAILGSLPAGISASFSNGNQTIDLTSTSFTVTAADYQAALQQIVFSNFTSTDTTARHISIFVDDGNFSDSQSNTAITTVTVSPNTAPTANTDAIDRTELGGVNNSVAAADSGPATGNVITNDTDSPLPKTLSVVSYGTGDTSSADTSGVFGSPLIGQYGQLTLNADGSFTYEVDNSSIAVQQLRSGDNPVDHFHYKIQDAGLLQASANINVTVHGAEDAPLAVNDLGTMTEESGPISFSARGNDSLDPDASDGATFNTIAVGAVTVSSAAAGTSFANTDATAVIDSGDPAKIEVTLVVPVGGHNNFQQLKAGETATIDVPYTLTGNTGQTSTAHLIVTVNGATDLPLAVDDGSVGTPLAITEDSLLAARTFAVLANDTLDLDHGALNTIAPGAVTVAPVTGHSEIDQNDITVATDGTNTKIIVTLLPDFQNLQVGEHADVTVHYALQGNTGELSGADLHVTVNGVNDAPVVTAGAVGSYTENASPAAIVPNLTLTDVDNTTLATAKVALTNSKTGDVLSVSGLGTTSGDVGNIHFDINNATHEVTLTAVSGTETVANYQSALHLVQFSNPSDALDATTRTFTVTATDTGDGTVPTQVTGTSGTANFTVIAVNDPPVNTVPTPAPASHFYASSNTNFTISGFQIADPDSNPDNVQVTLGLNHGGAITVASVAGGAPTITGNGTNSVVLTGTVDQINTTLANGGTGITYKSAAAFNGLDPTPGNNVETLQITTNDLGHNPSGALADQDSIAIGVIPKVWYIDDVAPGSPSGPLGSHDNPFIGITAFNNVNDGGAGHPAAGDTVFLYSGSYSTGITLLDNQKLIGQGDGLAVQDPFAAAGTNIQLVTAGARPVISVGGTGIGIDLASGNNVHGLDVATTAAGAIGIDDGALNNSVGNLSISNMQITGTGKAVDIDHGGALSVTLDKLTSTGSSTQGVNLGGNVTGSFTANDNTSTISGATGTDFNISTNGLLNVTYSGGITQASNAALLSVAGGHTGTLTFQTGTLSATNGSGLQFDNADGTYNLNGTNTLNGGDAGIDILNGSSGTFNFKHTDETANTTITNPTGTSFNLLNSDANVTYSGTITDNTGSAVTIDNHDAGTITFKNGSITSTGSGITVQNSAGTETFNNSTIALTTTTNNGVTLAGNTGGTINFTPVTGGNGLDISTTSGGGFIATGGGTVVVTDPTDSASNTIVSTSGVGLNISNTNIGSGGITFEKISSGGGNNNGIILNQTGTAAGNGGLHVTGNGSTVGASGGGVIANKTGSDGSTTQGSGIYLNNTKDVQLNGLQMNGFQNDGIYGTNVTGFTLDHTIINGANGTSSAGGSEEGAVRFDGLFGSASISNSTLGGVGAGDSSFADDLRVINSSGSLNRLTIDNTHFGKIGINGDNGLTFSSLNAATMNLTVQNSFSPTRSEASRALPPATRRIWISSSGTTPSATTTSTSPPAAAAW